MSEELFLDAACVLGLDRKSVRFDMFAKYLDLLWKWGSVYNLTSLKERDAWWKYHLLDSLSVFKFLPPGSLADVGSGAGFPGLVLGLASPERPISLIESNNKKCSFLREVIGILGLKNVKVVQARVESYIPENLYCCVISRAFSDLRNFYELTRHLCHPSGCLLAMKGKIVDKELNELPTGVINKVLGLEVPHLGKVRSLVILSSRPKLKPLIMGDNDG